jgi:nicotinate-nucleotide adenylyltransferase
MKDSSNASKIDLKLIFGGTFDPPHNGHILPLCELLDRLKVNECDLIPSHIPVHKNTRISSQHRLAMTKLLAKQDSRLRVNEIEISLDAPSYSAHTLERLNAQNPEQAICFVMGLDAFLGLSTWYEAESILSRCHIIVLMRSDSKTGTDQASKNEAQFVQYFKSQTQNRIFINDFKTYANNSEPYKSYDKATSSYEAEGYTPQLPTKLLALLPSTAHLLNESTQNAQNKDINGILRASKHGELVFFVNDTVRVSSTMVRQALQQGESVNDYLPPELIQYIQAHNLY